MRKKLVTAGGAMALTLLLAAPAAAHVTANPSEAPADSFFMTQFRVGHGCEGTPTTEVSVQIPSGVVSVHPQVKPGWEIDLHIGELDEPVELHGETITEGVQEIVWRSTTGGLLDEHMDEFGVSMRLPAEADGDVLWFPFVQECEEGEHRWVQIPDSVEQWGELDEPAPYIQLAAAQGGHGGEDEEATGSETDDTTPTGSTDDDNNTAMLLGGIGTGLGALALILALLAYRRAP